MISTFTMNSFTHYSKSEKFLIQVSFYETLYNLVSKENVGKLSVTWQPASIDWRIPLRRRIPWILPYAKQNQHFSSQGHTECLATLSISVSQHVHFTLNIYYYSLTNIMFHTNSTSRKFNSLFSVKQNRAHNDVSLMLIDIPEHKSNSSAPTKLYHTGHPLIYIC